MLWYKISAMYGMAAALISIRLFSFQFLVQALSENLMLEQMKFRHKEFVKYNS